MNFKRRIPEQGQDSHGKVYLEWKLKIDLDTYAIDIVPHSYQIVLVQCLELLSLRAVADCSLLLWTRSRYKTSSTFLCEPLIE